MQNREVLQWSLHVIALGKRPPNGMQTGWHLVSCVWRRCGCGVNNEKPLRPMQGGSVLLNRMSQ